MASFNPNQRISSHFYWAELTASQAAQRLGLDNTPSPAARANLQRLAEYLECVRLWLRSRPLIISSGYRSPAVNKAVGGSLNSAHMSGLAVDFICPDYGSPLTVMRAIEAAANNGVIPLQPFDQLIYEGTWVHLGLAELGVKPRMQVLEARFTASAPTRYIDASITATTAKQTGAA